MSTLPPLDPNTLTDLGLPGLPAGLDLTPVPMSLETSALVVRAFQQ